MNAKRPALVLLLVALAVLAGCRAARLNLPPAGDAAPEQPVTFLPLTGPAARSKAEFSGLAWHGDHLILLAQYPGRFGGESEDGALFTLDRDELRAYLDGEDEGPLEPRPVPLQGDLGRVVAGFEGFEALALHGDGAYLTVEARADGGMMGYLVRATVAPDLSAVRVHTRTLTQIPPQADLSNMSDESLVVYGGRLLTLYEANGANVNPAPVAHLFHAAPLEPAGTLPFPNVEYRVTDATAPDDEGRFWAINYLWPGDVEKLRPAPDPIAAEHGTGATHREETTVERLVEFRITPEGIVRTETPPIWLQLETKVSRNWEGVVRLDDRGFLLVTDTFPETLLAFVPLP